MPDVKCDHHVDDKASIRETRIGESEVMDEISSVFSDFDVKLLSDKFDSFSTSLDYQIGYLIQLLEKIKDKALSLLDSKEFLKVKAIDFEAYKNETQNTLSVLQKNIGILHSVCTEASKELRNIEEHDVVDIYSSKSDCKDDQARPKGALFQLSMLLKDTLQKFFDKSSPRFLSSLRQKFFEFP